MSNGSGLFGDQSPIKRHLLRGSGGLQAEVADVRSDVGDVLEPLAAISVDEFTDPAAAGAADLEAATATVAAERVVTTFLAGGVAKLAAYPRNITFTTAGVTPADAPANAVIVGTYRGKPQTETVVLAQTATIATGVKPFSTIESITFPAADGTDATVSIGVGAGLGVGQIPVSRAGLVAPIREIAAGAVVTNGVLTAEGLYTPNSVPDGSNDYAVYYEYNPQV